MQFNNKILNFLKSCNYKFSKTPILVGGLALEYYNIRKSGHDADFMICDEDWQILKKIHPEKINLFGGDKESDVDATINLKKECVDLIKTLYQFNYNYFINNCIEHNLDENNNIQIMSIRDLLFVKTLAADYNNDKKSQIDKKLIMNFIVNIKYNLSKDELDKYLKLLN